MSRKVGLTSGRAGLWPPPMAPTFARRRGLSFTLSLSGLLLAASAACTSADATEADGDQAELSATSGARRAICPAELKRCGHTITFPDHGETSVEVRGDFGGAATWESGIPMTRRDGVWAADT